MRELLSIEVGGVKAGGPGSELLVTGLDWGPVEVATNDVSLVGKDGLLPGRDLLGSQVVTVELSTNFKPSATALQQALALQERLFGVWHDPAYRVPGATAELVYTVEGRERRVYGRPRQISGFTVEVVARQGAGKITAQFVVTKPGSHGDLQQVRIDAVPASSGGLIAPLVSPLTTTKTGGTRQGLIEVEGGAAAIPDIRFRGPCTDPVLRSDDGRWEVGLIGTLQHDRTAFVDLARGRFSLPGNVSFSYRTNLSGVSLLPGTNSLTYSAADPTATSYVVVRWRDSFTSF